MSAPEPTSDLAAGEAAAAAAAEIEAPSRRTLRAEAWLASLGVLAALGLVKHIGLLVPVVRSWGFTVALGLQLYVPLVMRDSRGITSESLGLTAKRWRADLKYLLIWMVVITVPYVAGYHFLQTGYVGRPYTGNLTSEPFQRFLTQTLVVALAEELFFRGYLQERLQQLFPAKRKLFGAPFGLAIVLTSVVFALAHFVGEYRPYRLGPFFPSLLFGWFRARTGSILAAVGFHAYANLLSDTLQQLYR